jgi:hypothetical protein
LKAFQGEWFWRSGSLHDSDYSAIGSVDEATVGVLAQQVHAVEQVIAFFDHLFIS